MTDPYYYYLTDYIYPLEEKIVLSKKFNLCFDNPRSDEEANKVRKYIEYCFQRNPLYEIPEESLTQYLFGFLKEKATQSIFFSKLLNDYSTIKGFDLLARMWIIERHEQLETVNLCFLYSLLAGKTQNYLYRDSLFSDEYFIKPDSIATIPVSVYGFLSKVGYLESVKEIGKRNISISKENSQGSGIEISMNELVLDFFLPEYQTEKLLFFPDSVDVFLAISKLFDRYYHDDVNEMTIYISNFLELIKKGIKDKRIALVFLVSIIEILITHIPKNNYDTVSKQFQMKAAELICKNDKNKSIDQVKSRLREIYSMRSNVAHGNLRAFDAYINTDDKDKFMDLLLEEIYDYTRIVITEYLKNPKEVNLLKQR